VAGADDDAADLRGGQSFLTDAHRGRTHSVAREDAGRRRRHIADKQGQVAAIRIGTDAAMQAGIAKSYGEMPGGHGKILFPFRVFYERRDLRRMDSIALLITIDPHFPAVLAIAGDVAEEGVQVP